MMSSLCFRCLEGSVWFLPVRMTVCSRVISAVPTNCPDTELQQQGGVHLSYHSKLVRYLGKPRRKLNHVPVGSRENKCLDTCLFAFSQPSPLFYCYGHRSYGTVTPQTGWVIIHQLRKQPRPPSRPTAKLLQINSSTEALFSGVSRVSQVANCATCVGVLLHVSVTSVGLASARYTGSLSQAFLQRSISINHIRLHPQVHWETHPGAVGNLLSPGRERHSDTGSCIRQ